VAWRYAFAPERELPSFLEMFRARMAGQTLGYLTFAGPMLSEPVKAALLRREVPLGVGLGAALLEAGSFTIVSGFTLVVGVLPAVMRLAAQTEIQRFGWVVAGLFVLLLLWGRWLLRRRVRVASGFLRLVGRGPLRGWVEKRRAQVEEAEGELLDYYVRHRRRFRLMFAWDVAAQLFALAEIYVILTVMGVAVTWVDVLIIEALGKIVSMMFFFVPGRVGTEEGGYALIFKLLDFGLARGISLALVQRLRAIVWSLLGLLWLARYALRRPA
jgi:uncharacterized protein (TIRG00374 family)